MKTHQCLDQNTTAQPILWRLAMTFIQGDDPARQHILGDLDDDDRYDCPRCWRAICGAALHSITETAIVTTGGRDKAIDALVLYLQQRAGLLDVSTVDDDLQDAPDDLHWIMDLPTGI